MKRRLHVMLIRRMARGTAVVVRALGVELREQTRSQRKKQHQQNYDEIAKKYNGKTTKDYSEKKKINTAEKTTKLQRNKKPQRKKQNKITRNKVTTTIIQQIEKKKNSAKNSNIDKKDYYCYHCYHCNG